MFNFSDTFINNVVNDKKDYYNLLGIDKNCSQEEIKKAYKEKALKYHPDRNKDCKEECEKKFKEISIAYQTLSNKETKEKYDIIGEDYENYENFENIFDEFDSYDNLFNTIFNNFSDNNMSSYIFGNINKTNNKTENENYDIDCKLDINLEDVYNGNTIIKSIKRYYLCNNCNSLGNTRHDIKIKCNNCNGFGRNKIIEQFGGSILKDLSVICDSCSGQGYIFNKKYKCNNCNGMKKKLLNYNLRIKIPKGINDNEIMIIKNYGHQIDNFLFGNVNIKIRIKEHLNFKRDEHNLKIKKKIYLSDALTKSEILINHINKKKYIIICNDVITPYSTMIIKNKGMPIKNTQNYGDLLINFYIKFPKKIKKDRVEFIPKILPISNVDKNIDYDNYEEIEYNSLYI